MAEQNKPDDLLPSAVPESSLASTDIAKAFASGDLTFVQKKIKELAARKPRSYEVHYWTGYLALRQDKFYEAIRKLRQAEALDPNPAVLKLLALSYYVAHQNRLFLLKIREARQKQPADFEPYYYLGRYYDLELSDLVEAAKCFQQALARRPDHARSHYYLGHCWEVEQKPENAEAEYRRAAELVEQNGTSDGLGYQGLARLRLATNRPAEAMAFARRAVVLAGRDSDAHKLLARAYSDLGSTAEAAAEWKISSELDPTDASALYRLYRCYLSLGESEKARAALDHYEKVAALYGTN